MSKRPFFRTFDGWWYTQVAVGNKRKQVKLVKGKENEREAYRAFCRLMTENGQIVIDRANQSVANICDLFLDVCQRNQAKGTYLIHRRYLQDFCNRHGRMMIGDLKLYHVNNWLDSHPKWKACRRHAITTLKRALNWAEDEGYITTNPIRRIKRPPAGKRIRVLSTEERQRILDAITDEGFRNFVLVLQETGCRPSEAARVAAENVDLSLGIWVFEQHKTAKKTGKPRVVYLPPQILELSRELIQKYPSGPLLRDSLGWKFTSAKLVKNFKQLRLKTPELKHYSAYAFRHTYCTEALMNGVGIAQVAELLGHTGTSMVMQHYQHLNQKVDHMRELASKAMRQAKS